MCHSIVIVNSSLYFPLFSKNTTVSMVTFLWQRPTFSFTTSLARSLVRGRAYYCIYIFILVCYVSLPWHRKCVIVNGDEMLAIMMTMYFIRADLYFHVCRTKSCAPCHWLGAGHFLLQKHEKSTTNYASARITFPTKAISSRSFDISYNNRIFIITIIPICDIAKVIKFTLSIYWQLKVMIHLKATFFRIS